MADQRGRIAASAATWSWLQLQVGGSSTGATAQAQVSPFSTPLRLNPSLILTGGVSSGQRANSPDLTPNLSATLVGEALLGGPTTRPGYSIAFNGGFLYAPWAAGLLSNAAGGTAGLSFTAFRDYYRDAPAADADDRRPVAPTGTPNSTSTGPDRSGAGVSGTLTVGIVTGERPSHHR